MYLKNVLDQSLEERIAQARRKKELAKHVLEVMKLVSLLNLLLVFTLRNGALLWNSLLVYT